MKIIGHDIKPLGDVIPCGNDTLIVNEKSFD